MPTPSDQRRRSSRTTVQATATKKSLTKEEKRANARKAALVVLDRELRGKKKDITYIEQNPHARRSEPKGLRNHKACRAC